MTKDEFKVNFFFDENGPSFEELVMEIFEERLNEIIEKLSKDDNITEIYCANAKTQAGKDILLFAIAMRNKTEGAFMETYERVFSILDNDYAKLDSFLISTDLEPKNKIVLKIKGDGDFKVFDRKEI